MKIIKLLLDFYHFLINNSPLFTAQTRPARLAERELGGARIAFSNLKRLTATY